MSDSPVLINRRKVLGVLSTLGAAVATSSPASAFFFRRPASPSVNLAAFPQEWVNLQGRELNNYIDFLANLNLEKVTVHQVISAHAKKRGSVWNTVPPKALWKNLGTTLKVVDRIAREINQPVKEVVSAYRSPAYNARCAGAKTSSWHQSNFAMDITFPISARTITRTFRDYRNRGLFRGGVGGYGSFTHVDTRGVNVDW
jgi:hypothetical protein